MKIKKTHHLRTELKKEQKYHKKYQNIQKFIMVTGKYFSGKALSKNHTKVLKLSTKLKLFSIIKCVQVLNNASKTNQNINLGYLLF